MNIPTLILDGKLSAGIASRKDNGNVMIIFHFLDEDCKVKPGEESIPDREKPVFALEFTNLGSATAIRKQAEMIEKMLIQFPEVEC